MGLESRKRTYSQKGKVSPYQCKILREALHDGRSIKKFLEIVIPDDGISRSTLEYHVYGDCNHFVDAEPVERKRTTLQTGEQMTSPINRNEYQIDDWTGKVDDGTAFITHESINDWIEVEVFNFEYLFHLLQILEEKNLIVQGKGGDKTQFNKMVRTLESINQDITDEDKDEKRSDGGGTEAYHKTPTATIDGKPELAVYPCGDLYFNVASVKQWNLERFAAAEFQYSKKTCDVWIFLKSEYDQERYHKFDYHKRDGRSTLLKIKGLLNELNLKLPQGKVSVESEFISENNVIKINLLNLVR